MSGRPATADMKVAVMETLLSKTNADQVALEEKIKGFSKRYEKDIMHSYCRVVRLQEEVRNTRTVNREQGGLLKSLSEYLFCHTGGSTLCVLCGQITRRNTSIIPYPDRNFHVRCLCSN